MQWNTISNRYIFKELIPPFIISLFFLTFIFLMMKILDITNMIVNYKISLWAVALMLIYSMPFFFPIHRADVRYDVGFADFSASFGR